MMVRQMAICESKSESGYPFVVSSALDSSYLPTLASRAEQRCCSFERCGKDQVNVESCHHYSDCGTALSGPCSARPDGQLDGERSRAIARDPNAPCRFTNGLT